MSFGQSLTRERIGFVSTHGLLADLSRQSRCSLGVRKLQMRITKPMVALYCLLTFCNTLIIIFRGV